MPSFGEQSMSRLVTCHPDLVEVFKVVVARIDCAILEGVRTAERQAELFQEGKTTRDGVIKLSKHQLVPGKLLSTAVDVMPYPAVVHGTNIWNDEFRFTLFAGEVIATGWHMGVEVIWGGDWNRDGSNKDQTFHDLPHFELVQN